MNQYTADDLVLCESPDGWSLHAPGATDEDIATGGAPYLVCGTGEPTESDYAQALRKLEYEIEASEDQCAFHARGGSGTCSYCEEGRGD